MREIASFEQGIGGDGGKVQGKLGVEGSDLTAQVNVKYPIAKIIDPVMGVVDGLVDKLEAVIPGDQKAMAAQAKLDAREAIIKALSETSAVAELA